MHGAALALYLVLPGARLAAAGCCWLRIPRRKRRFLESSYYSLGKSDNFPFFSRFLPIFRTSLGDFNPQKLPPRRLQTLCEWKNREYPKKVRKIGGKMVFFLVFPLGVCDNTVWRGSCPRPRGYPAAGKRARPTRGQRSPLGGGPGRAPKGGKTVWRRGARAGYTGERGSY